MKSLNPAVSLRRALGTLVLLVAGALTAAADQPALGPTGQWASRSNNLHVGALWGQMSSSQLRDDTPIAFWSIEANLPLTVRHGLWLQLRFDSAVLGDPGRISSQLIHPDRTDYNLALCWQSPGLPLGLEAHHVSSHKVASLHKGDGNNFREEFDIGGASNFISLYLDMPGAFLRTGVGSVWVDTNTAPILLGFEGVLLNSNSARGPFASLKLPLPLPGGLQGHAGGLYVTDLYSKEPIDTPYAAWHLALHRDFGRRVRLGMNYAGNNPRHGEQKTDHLVGAYIKLLWRVVP